MKSTYFIDEKYDWQVHLYYMLNLICNQRNLIKATMKYHLSSIQLQKFKNLMIPSGRKGVETWNPPLQMVGM